MPILWRYLLSNYLKVLLLSTFGFIAILLTSRLDEIAHFASFGPTGLLTLLYALYQIPYILPIAIPVSCLISAILLMQNLSSTHELTALRSASFPIRSIIAPVLLASALIAIFNFYIVSELATDAHLEANLLKNELRSLNPLLLLQNKHLMRAKGYFFDTLGPSKLGQNAADIILAVPNKENDGINLIVAKNLKATLEEFQAEKLTFISSLGKKKEGYNDLLIDNIGSTHSSLDDFSPFLQKKVTHLSNDHLNLGLLLIRLRDYSAQALQNSEAHRSLLLAYAEIIRRLSAALSPFTFTLMGLSFGIKIGRKNNSKKVLLALLLSTLYLTSFFAGKGAADNLLIASTLYFLPHIMIIFFSIYSLRRVSQGIA